MNEVTAYLLASLILLLLSVVTICVFRRHLIAVLTDLTGTVDRARFWTTLISFLLITIPQLTGMYCAESMNNLDTNEPMFFLVVSWLRLPITSLIATLLGVAATMIWFIQTRTRE